MPTEAHACAPKTSTISHAKMQLMCAFQSRLNPAHARGLWCWSMWHGFQWRVNVSSCLPTWKLAALEIFRGNQRIWGIQFRGIGKNRDVCHFVVRGLVLAFKPVSNCPCIGTAIFIETFKTDCRCLRETCLQSPVNKYVWFHISDVTSDR